VDDDASDDSATLVLSEQTDIVEAVTSWLWSAGVAVILIGIMWKLNLLWPQEKTTIMRSRKGPQKKSGSVSSEQTSQSGKSRQAARGDPGVEVQIESTSGTEKPDAMNKSPPEDMLTEPSMEAAPPTSIMTKYRTGSKSDDGDDIDSRIDRMLSRKEFD